MPKILYFNGIVLLRKLAQMETYGGSFNLNLIPTCSKIKMNWTETLWFHWLRCPKAVSHLNRKHLNFPSVLDR